MSRKGKLATLDDNAALDRLRSGTLMKTIAAEYGVAKESLHERLKKHPEYKQAIIDQAESFVEAATDEAMNTPLDDTVAIQRARLRVDTAHKWAAARDPERWGLRTTLSLQVDLGAALQQMSAHLQAESANTYDHEPVLIDKPEVE